VAPTCHEQCCLDTTDVGDTPTEGCALLADWVAGSGARSFRVCGGRPPAHGLHVLAELRGSSGFCVATFGSAAVLAEALQQPCRRVGLTCLVEDNADGKAVIMQRTARR
jgi:hypothetical protein